jgi:DNA-binding CsgD family transcriptional regulator
MAQSPQLSDREWEVVELLRQGKSNKLIAAALTISERTVEFHLKNIYTKFEVSSRVELILKLGNTPDEVETKKLGESTVDGQGENAENEVKLNSQKNWVTSLRETISLISKELRMENLLQSNANDGTSPMTFQESIRVCFSKYADFSGQATRAEFWWFALFVVLVTAALLYVSEALSGVFSIAILLPLLAVGARRLHDTGRSGWWQLFMLVPVGGLVTLAILWAMPGTAQFAADEPSQ